MEDSSSMPTGIEKICFWFIGTVRQIGRRAEFGADFDFPTTRLPLLKSRRSNRVHEPTVTCAAEIPVTLPPIWAANGMLDILQEATLTVTLKCYLSTRGPGESGPNSLLAPTLTRPRDVPTDRNQCMKWLQDAGDDVLPCRHRCYGHPLQAIKHEEQQLQTAACLS